MKNYFLKTVLSMVTIGLLFFTSCNDDGGEDPVPEYGKPTITILSPEIPAEGLNVEVGSTINFTINVTAEAGLSTLKLGDNTIKTFTGTETDEEVQYDHVPLEAGSVTLSFVIEDAVGESTTKDVLLVVEEGEDLGYLLIDFAGAMTSSEEKTVVDWDIRTLYTFGVSGSHGTSATAEAVNKQAQLEFAQDNPSTEDNSKVIKIVKTITEGRDNWFGWAHIIFGLGSTISQDIIDALPTWDNDQSATVPGTKVIKVDAYYDATVDGAVDWDSLTSLVDIWNADPSLGYKVDIAIAAYDPMGIAENGHDGGMFIGYSAYIGEPNKWVTLTFDVVDEARAGSFYGIATEAPGPADIDCIKFLPSPGYVTSDSNPLYLKNLRIVDVE